MLQEDSNLEETINVEPAESRIADIFENEFQAAVEAILFASPEPLEEKEISRIAGCRKKEVDSIIEALNNKYSESGRSFRIEKFSGRYRFFTLPEFDKFIVKLADIPKPVRLSRAALEVLSIIAYRQPTSKSEIEKIRGINPDGVLRTIMEKGLVEICGRSDGPGRPLLYGTTREFLDFFGISDLNELPVPDIPEDEGEARSLILKKSLQQDTPEQSDDET